MVENAANAPFIMHGARAALAAGMLHIEEHVKGIERAVVENPGLAFDLAKTLIESACRKILTERKIAYDPNDDVPKLFKTATTCLPFLPPSASAESGIRKSLVQTLNGLHTTVLGICELRNACGFASHGSDSHRPAMEGVQAVLAAEAADAIVGFLHRVHYQERLAPSKPHLEYEGNQDFNDHVDRANEVVRIFDLEYRPSEVLFRIDYEAYRVYLAEYEPEPAENEGPDYEVKPEEGKS